MIDRSCLLFPQDVFNCEVKSRTKLAPFYYVEHMGSCPSKDMVEKILTKAASLVPENHFWVKIERDGATDYYNVLSGLKQTATLKVNGRDTFISRDFNPEMEGDHSPEELFTYELETLLNINGNQVLAEEGRETTEKGQETAKEDTEAVEEEGCQSVHITYNIIGEVTRENRQLTINYEDGTALVLSGLAYEGCHKEIIDFKAITAEKYEKALETESTFEETIPF